MNPIIRCLCQNIKANQRTRSHARNRDREHKHTFDLLTMKRFLIQAASVSRNGDNFPCRFSLFQCVVVHFFILWLCEIEEENIVVNEQKWRYARAKQFAHATQCL